MTLQATGRKDERDPSWVVFSRTFRAPVEDVWAAVTEPDRLERWIGTWEGDPASGQVQFTMTAEGEGAQPAVNQIEECRPPYLLPVSVTEGASRGSCGSSSGRPTASPRSTSRNGSPTPSSVRRTGRAGSTTSTVWWPRSAVRTSRVCAGTTTSRP